MKTLFKEPNIIATVNTNGKGYKRGKDLKNVEILQNHSIIAENGIIKDILPNSSIAKAKVDMTIDLKNLIVLP